MMNEVVRKRIVAFEQVLGREIANLEERTVGYAIVYTFLATTVQRMECYIKHNAPSLPPDTRGLPPDFCQRMKDARERYLSDVAALLQARAGRYRPEDGSVPEDIGSRLTKLAQFADDLRQANTEGCVVSGKIASI